MTKSTTKKINGGFVLKARRIQYSKIAHAPPHVREVWDYIIREAAHTDKQVDGIDIKRGQLHTNADTIVEDTHWWFGRHKMSYKKHDVTNALRRLRKADMITTTPKRRGILVSITNYDIYQDAKNYGYGANDEAKVTIDEVLDDGNKTEEPESTKVENIEFIKTHKKRKLTGKKLDGFKKLWDVFCYKHGRAQAADAYLELVKEMEAMPKDTDEAATLWRSVLAGAKQTAQARPALESSGLTPKMLQGWLTARRWEDEADAPRGAPGGLLAPTQLTEEQRQALFEKDLSSRQSRKAEK